MIRTPGVTRKQLLGLCLCGPLLATGCSAPDDTRSAEESFRTFLDVYIERIDARDASYLQQVHPTLPPEMQDFYFDVTRDMMGHSRDQGLEPEIECQEYQVCKVTWTQAGGSWAAQSFILHEDEWRVLAQ